MFKCAALALGCFLFLLAMVANGEDAELGKEMNFWSTIEKARGPGGDRAHADRLRKTLAQHGPEDIATFAQTFHAMLQRADKGELWAAAMLIHGGRCSDDCFLYFRNWLISRGRVVFERTLKDPDSLSSMKGIGVRSTSYEGYGAVPASVYRNATGTDLVFSARAQAGQAQRSWDWLEFSNDRVSAELPKLWAKYGPAKVKADHQQNPLERTLEGSTSVSVPGIGVVRVGSVIRHRELGVGTVIAVVDGPLVNAIVKFGNESRPVVLSPTHFELVK